MSVHGCNVICVYDCVCVTERVCVREIQWRQRISLELF